MATEASTPPLAAGSNVFGTAALLALLVAGVILLPRVFQSRDAALVGRIAPDFHLAVVANGLALGLSQEGVPSLDMHDLRGRAVVLDFWATWCPPCRAQAPIVDRVARRWHDHGVVVIGVNTDGPVQGDPREYALAHSLTYPIVVDPSASTSRSYEVEALPTLVVVSRTGKVVAVRTGITEDEEIERLIRQAL